MAFSVFSIPFTQNNQKAELKRLNLELENRIKTITMHDIDIFCEEAGRKLKNWIPDVIYAPDARGGIIGLILVQEIGSFVPVICGCVAPVAKKLETINKNGEFNELRPPNGIFCSIDKLSISLERRFLFWMIF